MQRACEVQTALDSTGQKPMAIDADEILEKSAQLVKVQSTGKAAGELEFAALLRKVEKLDPSFNDFK